MIRKRIVTILTLVLFTFAVSGCGTILHPERKGQAAGEIDPKIAILNGLGLILFIVPGVIAFAVDFNNGSIYLPGGSSSAVEQSDNNSLVVINSDREMDKHYLEQVVLEKVGEFVDLDAETVEAQLITAKEPLRAMVRYM